MFAPTRAPGMTPITSTTKIAQAIWPRTACTIVLGTATIAIRTSDVPRAPLSGIPSIVVTSGTKSTPPPTPSSPETNPVNPPRTAYAQPGLDPRGRTAYSPPNPTRIACHPISTAVTRSNQCGSTRAVSHAPATAPTTPGTAAKRIARQLTSPARAYVEPQTIAVGMITGRGVPTAMYG